MFPIIGSFPDVNFVTSVSLSEEEGTGNFILPVIDSFLPDIDTELEK